MDRITNARCSSKKAWVTIHLVNVQESALLFAEVGEMLLAQSSLLIRQALVLA